jgi:SAM-dependent methyltransferase
MSDDPFLARLKARAEKAVAAAEEAVPETAKDPGPPATEPAETQQPPQRPRRQPRPRRSASAPTAAYSDRRAVAFWQSEIAQAHIRRRITGDEEVPPTRYFAGLLEESVRDGTAVVLGGGDPSLAVELLREGACAKVAIIDDSQERLDYARARVPEDLRAKVDLTQADLLAYEPEQPPTLVATVSALHRLPDPDAAVARITQWLAPGGLVYVDEFVGPDRFQWTERQIEIVNRLLACLPEELRRDLSTRGEIKKEIARPDPERFTRDHPNEAVAPTQIRPALDAHLDPITVKPYGGAIFHQLFARIMGNFARRPELVRLILEFDAILTDLEAIDSDYLWAAYRKPAEE